LIISLDKYSAELASSWAIFPLYWLDFHKNHDVQAKLVMSVVIAVNTYE
jgi:hypothetical protein